MPARRFRMASLSKDAKPGAEIALPPDAAHKAHHVLRLAPGEEIVVFDGTGAEWIARLTRVEEGSVTATLDRAAAVVAEAGCAVTLCLCLLKGGRFEWAIQKATELGVRRIVPMVSSRTIARIDPGGRDAAAKMKRFQLIVQEACAQSARSVVPTVSPITPFDSVIADLALLSPRLLLEVTASERLSEGYDFESHPKAASLLVGPEGGWEPKEIQAAERHGWLPVTLGPATLRADTAPVAALSILLHLAGEIG